MKASKLFCLAVFVLCFVGNPIRTHAQWDGPSYSYDGNYPDYVITFDKMGDSSTDYTNYPQPLVHVWSGGSGGSGSATVQVKFKAAYYAAPGTPSKTVYIKADFTGSYTVTGTGTGLAECKGICDGGSIDRDTTNSGNPISPVKNTIGNALASAPYSFVHSKR